MDFYDWLLLLSVMFPDLSVWYHKLVLYSFLWPDNILLSILHILYPFISWQTLVVSDTNSLPGQTVGEEGAQGGG